MKSGIIATAVLGVVVSVTPAMAQQPDAPWSASIAVGRLDTTFRPYYTYPQGGTPDQFENEAAGWEVQVLAAHRRRLSDRLSLSVQGSAALNSFSWTLSIPEEPAALEYSLPYRVAISLAPDVQLGSRLVVFAEVGGGFGRVRERKTLSAASTYDFDRMRPTLNLGGGVRLNASSGIDLFVRVEHIRYATHEFDTFSPSNVLVEHVKDSPRALGVSVGVTRRF